MEEIYRQYSKQIYNYLVYISHDKDLAEELTQETFNENIKQKYWYKNGILKCETISTKYSNDYIRFLDFNTKKQYLIKTREKSVEISSIDENTLNSYKNIILRLNTKAYINKENMADIIYNIYIPIWCENNNYIMNGDVYNANTGLMTSTRDNYYFSGTSYDNYEYKNYKYIFNEVKDDDVILLDLTGYTIIE